MTNLSQIQNDYERDGVVRVRGLLSRQEVAELRERIGRYAREVAPQGKAGSIIYEADGVTVRNLFHMHANDPAWVEFARQPRFLELVEPLVHGQAEVWGVETFNKPAKVGSVVPPHQDNAYFCQTPPDILSLWIALDPATAENGAVQYVKGTHHAMLPHKPSGVKGNSFGLAEAPPAGLGLFMGELEPGDALVHHSQAIHFSEPNRSDRARLGLVIVYRGAHTQTDPQALARYQAAAKQVFGT